MKFLLLFCLLGFLLAAPQDPPGILSGTFSTPNVPMNRLGDNTFTLTYTAPFNSIPYFGLALIQLSSPVAPKYAVLPRIQSQTASNVFLNVRTPENIWVNLGYSWIASVSSVLSVVQFSAYWPVQGNIGQKTFPRGSLNIPAGAIKVDTLIAGFNYASTNNQFNIKVAPHGTVLQGTGLSPNPYSDEGVTLTPFNGFFTQSATETTFPYMVFYNNQAFTGFSELVISLVVHSITLPAGIQSPVSSGFNTMTVVSQTPYVNLFNPLMNKNNLGVETVQKFFGFTEISILTVPIGFAGFPPTGGVDAQVTVNTPSNSSILSSSNFVSISTSYFFYQNNADNICALSNLPTSTLISPTYNNWICKTVTNTQVSSTCGPYASTQDTYVVAVSSLTAASLYLDIPTVIGTTYAITFNLLDGGSSFQTPQLTVRLGNLTVAKITATPLAPWRGALILGTPADSHIQNIANYMRFKIYVTPTQSLSRLEFEFADQSPLSYHTYYLKAVSMTSGNLIFDTATQACVQSCSSNQMITTNTIPNVCTTCSSQGRIFDASTGTCACPLGSYASPTSFACVRCFETSCERCSPTNSAICTSCPINRVLSSGKCVCGTGFFEIDGACVTCNPGCTSCNGNPNICVSCIANTNRVQANGACACIDGYFDAGQANCVVCPASCLTCTRAQTASPTPACSSCPANSNRVSAPINNNCPCLEGYTERAVQGQTCQPCHFSCNRCTGSNANQCIDCNLLSLRVPTAAGTCVCSPGYTDLGFPYCVSGTSCANIPGCVACTNGVCSRCDSAQYKVYNSSLGRCVCQDGYLQYSTSISSDFTCAPCALGCARCSAQGVCSQCYSGVAITTTCQCPIGSFPDFSTLSCQPCSSGCQTCTSRFSCSICSNPLIPSNGVCVCPLGTYYSGNTCQSCPQNCQACNGTGQCVLCSSGFLLQITGSCAATCPTQTYTDGYKCSRCSNNCLLCTGSSTCTSCASGTILYSGLCITTCPDGTYATSANPPQCLSCSSTCQTCTGPMVCTSCPSGRLLFNGLCINNCYSGSVASAGSCVPCTQCLTCFMSSSICTTCPPPSRIVFETGQCVATCAGYFPQGNYCYVNCPSGLYASGGTCLPCNSNCLTCMGTPTNCTSCPRVAPLLQISNLQNICVASCTGSSVLNENQCQPCSASCAGCYPNNHPSCVTCADGYVSIGAGTVSGSVICIRKCVGNSFNNGSACVACPVACSGCMGSTACLSCSSTSAVLVNGQCTSCAPPCSTCLPGSASICTSCIAPSALSSSTCVTSCPTDQQNTNGVCLCRTGLFTYQNLCVAACPPTTTSVNSICQLCSGNCATCSQSTTNCTSCIAGYNLAGSNCVLASTCPYGQVANAASSCTSICSSNLFFYDTYCVSTCPSNYAPNSALSGCVLTNSNQDRQCGGGLYYSNGVCVSSCPIATVGNQGACISCPSNCAYCPALTSCTSCMVGYYLSPTNTCILSAACAPPQISFQGGCLTSCPEGTFQQSYTCNRICDAGTYYYQGLCYYQNCPNRLYRTEFSCVSVCPSGTTLDSTGTCAGSQNFNCPSGSYLTQAGGCAVCQTPCASCIGTATNCTACITGTLTGNVCTTTPPPTSGSGGSVVITIQSSSIYNNRVQARIQLSNIPPSLTQLQQNQLLNVVVYPNTNPTPQVYQWIEVSASNTVNVVVVFPGPINPSTTILFSLNIPAVGSVFNQQGITNLAGANAQLAVSSVPQASSIFAIPAYVSAVAAQAATTQRAG